MLRRRFGPSSAERQAVESSLRRSGLEVTGLSADGLTVRVRATAGAMATAFATSFEQVRLGSGAVDYVNTRPARLGASAAREIGLVLGLSDVPAVRPSVVSAGSSLAPGGHAATPRAPSPAATAGFGATTRAAGAPSACAAARAEARYAGAYTASQLAGAYAMTGLYKAGDLGAGVTVGIEEFEPNLPSDVAAYEKCYGIDTAVSYVPVDGGSRPRIGPGSGEAALDIEDVAGLAPAAHIVVYQAPNSNRGFFDEMQWIVDHPTAQVVTTSWGECEPALGSTGSGGGSYSLAAARKAARAQDTLVELAAAEGQSWLAASGDEGSTDCWGSGPLATAGLSVDDPGSLPYVTSVGGTTLRLSVRHERVWNNFAGAGGGGQSALWPMPAYQAGAPASVNVVGPDSSGAGCEAATGYCREVPDVAANADPNTGYVVYDDGSWGSVGGTSAAAPLWAAVVALTDASQLCGGSSVGFLNPSLYAIAATTGYRSSFHDIVTGNDDYQGSGYVGGLYPAGPGYDMASGLGSPKVTSGATSDSGGLAEALCGLGPAAPPGVDRVTPDSGPAAGGNTVTLYGYGFSEVTGVYFGTHRAAFTVGHPGDPSPTWIRVTVPAAAAPGTVWVRVRTRHGPSPRTAGAQYRYT